MYVARNIILFNSVCRINYSFSLVCHQRYRAEAESGTGPPLGETVAEEYQAENPSDTWLPPDLVSLWAVCLPTAGLVFSDCGLVQSSWPLKLGKLKLLLFFLKLLEFYFMKDHVY